VPHVRASVRGPNMDSSIAFAKRVENLDGLCPSFATTPGGPFKPSFGLS
jgi:hypothetical protein